MQGKTIIVTAPSGAGKTTIVRHLLGMQELNLTFSISACTRPRRDVETHGRDYYFMTIDDFKNRIEEDEFVEWEEVYKNCYYGTLKGEVDRIWKENRNILFDVDVMGGLTLKQKFGSRAFALFVQPPSLEVLRQRLLDRGTDSVADIEGRINKAALELKYAGKFDEILINNHLDVTLKDAEILVRTFLEKQ